jgi:hypothetical protein
MHDNYSWCVAGIGDQCSNRGVKSFTQELITYSGVQGFCVYASCLINYFSCLFFNTRFISTLFMLLFVNLDCGYCNIGYVWMVDFGDLGSVSIGFYVYEKTVYEDKILNCY